MILLALVLLCYYYYCCCCCMLSIIWPANFPTVLLMPGFQMWALRIVKAGILFRPDVRSIAKARTSHYWRAILRVQLLSRYLPHTVYWLVASVESSSSSERVVSWCQNYVFLSTYGNFLLAKVTGDEVLLLANVSGSSSGIIGNVLTLLNFSVTQARNHGGLWGSCPPNLCFALPQ